MVDNHSRRSIFRVCGLAGIATISGCTMSSQSTGDLDYYRNPVYEPLFPDPTVIRVDERGAGLSGFLSSGHVGPTNTEWERRKPTANDASYYAYGTMMGGLRKPSKERKIPILKSDDLVEWKYVGDAFEQLPNWIENPESLWAPDIAYYDERYYLFYSLVPETISDWGSGISGPTKHGIGVATAPTPKGPFTDQGAVVTRKGEDLPLYMDPHLFVDDGTPYLVWGIGSVRIAKLGPDLQRVVEEPTLLTGHGFQEGGYLVRRNGYYYLLFSSGDCCPGYYPGYQVEVGRSKDLKGPYVNSLGDSLLHHPGMLVLDHNDRFGGPGHNSLVTYENGTDWMLYHAYDTRDPKALPDGTFRRVLLIDPLAWKNGWPRVPNREPSTNQLVPGDWMRRGD